ncbi:MAG TPA: transglutaminase-like cysteine peptidase [Devosia sp.]|jgi:predicted transglutaminase-like cysteine proteinase|nr:transglutaminase-like cysteine peptidase [Devosia sp.]
MLNKTIVLGAAIAVTLLTTGPGTANVEASFALRPSFDSTANWLKPASTLAAAGTALSTGVHSTVVLEASLDPHPVVTLRPSAPLSIGDYGLFGSVALPMGTLPATKQWRSVSATDFTTQYGAHCRTAACATGVDGLLTKAALKAEGQPALEALTLINSSVNHLIRYRSDAADHWATPVETAARGSGDCEDFAIAKLWLLRSIGYGPEQLQLVILRDTRTTAFHAVLAVHVNGRRYILDNLSNRVLTDDALKAYVPIESFAGDKTFIHGFAKKPVAPPTLAAEIQPAS